MRRCCTLFGVVLSIAALLWAADVCAAGSAAAIIDISSKEEQKLKFVRELEENIEKVNGSIKVIEEQIETSKDALYLPDLYFKLAELYVEKSRYLYYKRREEYPERETRQAISAPASKEAKEIALETYQRILNDFPDYANNDRVLFYMAHELREMTDIPGMLARYNEIIRKYPRSIYRPESYLIIGNHYFDQKNLRQAKEMYQKILGLAENPVSNNARYKLGWVYINEDNNERALRLFEQVAKMHKRLEAKQERPKIVEDETSVLEEAPKSNIVREALVDSVLAYTEVRKAKNAVAYYRKLSDNEMTFKRVLRRLGSRYFTIRKYKEAAMIYREHLKLSSDLEQNIEQLRRVFFHVRQSQDISHASEDMDALTKTLTRYLHSWRIDEKEKIKAYGEFEKYARDISTKLHKVAQKQGGGSLFDASTKAYKQYLFLFEDSDYAKEIKYNYAESLYASNDYTKAGSQYETIAGTFKAGTKQHKDSLQSSLVAYFDALKQPDKLSRVQLIDARRGFIKSASIFIQSYPSDKETPNLVFSIGRNHYDMAEYDKAVEWFNRFVNKYPNHKKMAEAGHLAMDAFHQRKDFEGLARQGRTFLANRRIRDAGFRKEMTMLVQQAEFKKIEGDAVGEADEHDEAKAAEAAEAFLEFGQKYRRSELGEKALYNAFATAKRSNNYSIIVRSGMNLIREFPRSKLLKEVYPILGNISIQVGNYDGAARYFEQYSRKFSSDQEASNLLYNAGTMRRLLGQYTKSTIDYDRVLRQGGRSDRDEILWHIVLNYEKQRNWAGLKTAVRRAIKGGRNTVAAHTKLGNAHDRLREKPAALRAYKNALNLFQRIPSSRRSAEDVEAAGEAQYQLVLIAYSRFFNVKIRRGANEAKIVQRKNQLLSDLEQQASRIAQIGSARWSLAAVYLVGRANINMAAFLGQTSVPKGLNRAQLAQYRKILRDNVRSYKEKGNEIMRSGFQQAASLNLFSYEVHNLKAGRRVASKVREPRRGRVTGADAKRSQVLAKTLMGDDSNYDALKELAMIQIRAGDFHKARVIASRALEVFPGNGDFQNLLGVALYGVGEHQAAYGEFERAWNQSKQKAAGLNMAGLYWRYGYRQKANGMAGRAGRVSKARAMGGEYIKPVRQLSR